MLAHSLLCILLSLCLFTVHGKEVFVNVADGILEGIKNADNGDVIVLQSGNYTASTSNSNLNVLGRSLSFRSQTGNPSDVILDGLGLVEYTPFIIYYNESLEERAKLNTSLSLSGITFMNCGHFNINYNNTYGGAVFISSDNVTGSIDVQINNCIFNGGGSYHGGAIFIHEADSSVSLSLSLSSFVDNEAFVGGSIFSHYGNIKISETNFTKPNVTLAGGALFSQYSKLTLSDVSISNSKSINDGAAIYLTKSTFNMNNSTIIDSFASGDGGAIFAFNSSLSILSSSFYGNVAEKTGGAIVNFQSTTTISGNTEFSQNSALSGGAIYDLDGSQLTLVNCHFYENFAKGANGGTIFGGASVFHFVDSTFDSGDAFTGGSLYMAQTNITTNNIVFSNNYAQKGGAIVLDAGSVGVFNKTEFTSNEALEGGAMYLYSSGAILIDTTIRGNKANESGGGIYMERGSILQLHSSAIIGNTATNGPSLFCSNSVVGIDSSVLLASGDEKGIACDEKARNCRFRVIGKDDDDEDEDDDDDDDDDDDWSSVCARHKDDDDDDGLKRWQIGVISGVVVFCVMIIVAVSLFVIKKRQKKPTSAFYQI